MDLDSNQNRLTWKFAKTKKKSFHYQKRVKSHAISNNNNIHMHSLETFIFF